MIWGGFGEIWGGLGGLGWSGMVGSGIKSMPLSHERRVYLPGPKRREREAPFLRTLKKGSHSRTGDEQIQKTHFYSTVSVAKTSFSKRVSLCTSKQI